MITKMKKLSFLIHSKEYDQFLEHLRALGVVHVIQKQQGAVQDQALQDDINLLARCRNALKTLEPLLQQHNGDGSLHVIEAGSPFDEFVKKAQEEPSLLCTDKILERFDILEADKVVQEQTLQALNRDRAQLLPWGDFDPHNVERLVNAGYKLRFFTCPLRAYKPEWEQEYNAIEIMRDKQKVNFVTVTHTGTQVVGVPVLQDAVKQLDSKIDFGRVKLTGEHLAADTLLLLEGWIPADKVEDASRELDLKGVFFEVDDPTPDDDIPIQLSNNKFARLFEPLTKLYMLPTYQELDLTLFFAPFFMLFFGLCLGDTGYGLLMIVALPIFTKLFQLINPNFSKWLVVLFGISTMLCGLLSGTFFGFNMYDLDIPFIQKMKGLLYTDNSTMFTVSLCIGVVQILFGMGIKAVNLAIQCGFKYALSTIGWLVLLITVGVAALAGLDFKSPLILGILIVAAVLIFLFNSPGKNPLLNIGLGLWDTYNMATGLLGDVLSYVRLFALGLSGGILANVFNSMAVGMAPDNKVAGFIVMVLIFVIGHALNIFMNILGAIVHPMRLTFVEFFKNAGYAGGGMEYKPFRANG